MRRILRTARTAIVLTIVFLMTVDTANACRLFSWLFANRAACCTSDATSHGGQLTNVPTSYPVMSDPVVVSSDVYRGVVSNGCCCSGNEVAAYPTEFSYVDDGPIVESYPMAGAEVYRDEVEVIESYDASPVDIVPMDNVIAPAEDEVAPIPDIAMEELDEQAPTEANPLEAAAEEGDGAGGGDLFGGGGDTAPDVDPLDTPADEGAGDGDLFGGDAAQDADPLDAGDAFDAAPTPGGDVAPADGGGDLFGGDAAPADDGAAAAADDGGDLFGGDAADEGDLFGGDAAPADEGGNLFGGDAAPADDGGDLFEGGDTAPADDGGDLFDDGGGDAAPADGGDLFDDGDAPADDADDLFGGIQDSTPAADEEVAAPIDQVPVADDPIPAVADDDLNDLFGQNRRRNGLRVWTDDSGTYKTVGRLVVIAKTHVRLLKDNGRYSTVPLHRLSDQDLDYVMVVAKKLTGSQRIASR